MTFRQTIRRAMQQQRRQLPLVIRQQASLSISRFIATSSWFQRSRHIAFYWPVRGEIDPLPLLQRAWSMGKTCYLPLCHPLGQQSLLFMPHHPGELLVLNRYGIFESPIKNLSLARKPYALDVVFTPLVAFDDQKNRLGSGKGYYDKTFAYLNQRRMIHKPTLVGLAYQFQQCSEISAELWDVALDKVVVYDIEYQGVRDI
ncbi:MAG TPA: 5-formyltetrahydrofolate cyclo-ligase [Gammaproteobacteria bacterium]|nr:5-formyltetrahydrofolate cyclo-ligase [Gammaproteobacteria bacterium]